jgi:hypothetical protein
MSKALVLGGAALAFSAVGASAADFATPAYGYAAPAYATPAPTFTAPRVVYPAPVYTAPPAYMAPAPVYTAPAAPVVSGYYAPPVASQPIYDYAPGYGYDYTAPGYWNRVYWGRDYGFEWR